MAHKSITDYTFPRSHKNYIYLTGILQEKQTVQRRAYL